MCQKRAMQRWVGQKRKKKWERNPRKRYIKLNYQKLSVLIPSRNLYFLSKRDTEALLTHAFSSLAICAASMMIRVWSSLCLYSVTVSSKKGTQLHAMHCCAKAHLSHFWHHSHLRSVDWSDNFPSVQHKMHHRKAGSNRQLPGYIAHTLSNVSLYIQ